MIIDEPDTEFLDMTIQELFDEIRDMNARYKSLEKEHNRIVAELQPFCGKDIAIRDIVNPGWRRGEEIDNLVDDVLKEIEKCITSTLPII